MNGSNVWAISDGQAFSMDVRSTEDLVSFLNSLGAEQLPVVYDIGRRGGPFIQFCFFESWAFLNYHGADDVPPYMSSVRSPLRNGPNMESVGVLYADTLSEIPSQFWIPRTDATTALIDFFMTEELPWSISWTGD